VLLNIIEQQSTGLIAQQAEQKEQSSDPLHREPQQILSQCA
jgi:hypothetical protein